MSDKETLTRINSTSLFSQQFPQGKLLAVVGQKQTGSGFSNNERLLYLNTQSQMIGYTEWIPTKFPLKSINDMKSVKKMVKVGKAKISQCRDKLCAIEIKCEEILNKDMKVKGKNESWIFYFQSARLTREVFQGFTNAINEPKDGGVKKENKTVESRQEVVVESKKQSKVEMKEDIKVSNTETVNEVVNTKTINNTIVNTTTHNVEEQRTDVVNKQVAVSNVNQQRDDVVVSQIQTKPVRRETVEKSQVPSVSQVQNSTLQREVVHHYHIINNHTQQALQTKPGENGLQFELQSLLPQPTQASQVQAPVYNQPIQPQPQPQSQLIPFQSAQASQIQTIQPLHLPIPPHPTNQIHINFPISSQRSHLSSLPSPINPVQRTISKRNSSREQAIEQYQIFDNSIKLKTQKPFTKRSSQKVKAPQYKIQQQLHRSTNPNKLRPNSTFSPPKHSNASSSRSSERNQERMRYNEHSSRFEDEDSNFYEIMEAVENQQALSPDFFKSPLKFPVKQKKSAKDRASTNSKSNNSFQKASLFFELQKDKEFGSHSKRSRTKEDTESHLSLLKPAKRIPPYLNEDSIREEKDWNQQLYFSQNPYSIINKFKQQATRKFKSIIDALCKGDTATFQPVYKDKRSIMYEQESISFKLSFSPYHQIDSRLAKRELESQFEDYKYLSLFMKQKDTMRVPLVTLICYKGVMCLAKAVIEQCKVLKPEQLRQQLSQVEASTKLIKSHVGSSCKFKQVSYTNKLSVVYVDEPTNLLPIVDGLKIKANLVRNYVKLNPNTFFNNVLIGTFRKKQIEKIIDQVQNLSSWILSPGDLDSILEINGINPEYITNFYMQTNKRFLKPIFLTTAVADIAVQVLEEYLEQELRGIVEGESSQQRMQEIAIIFSKNLLESTNQSKQQWEGILKRLKLKIKTRMQMDDVMWGFLLQSYTLKSNLKINSKSVLDRDEVEIQNWISSESVLGFEIRSKSPLFASFHAIHEISEILSSPPTSKGLKTLQEHLKVKNLQIFLFDSQLKDRIWLYIAEMTSPSYNGKQFNPYNMTQSESFSSLSASLLLFEVKYQLSHQNKSAAIKLLEQVLGSFQFWIGQFHPVLSEFYDIYAAYFLMIEENTEALVYAKSSLMNMIKALGQDELLVAEKEYLLGNVFLSCQQEQNALANYQRSKYIYTLNNQSSSKQCKIVELKIAELYIHFDQINESMKMISAIFNSTRDQEVVLQCFQKTSKACRTLNEITQMKNNARLCYECFQEQGDMRRYIRMLKVCLEPGLVEIPYKKKRGIVMCVREMRVEYSDEDYFQELKSVRREGDQVIERVLNALMDLEWNTKRSVSREESRDQGEGRVLLECVVGLVKPEYILSIIDKQE